MTPANRADARAGPGRQDQPVHVPARPAAERPRALRQPADRRGDRRNARGGHRGRRPARAALRGRAGARRPRRRRALRPAGGRRRQPGRDAARRRRGRPCCRGRPRIEADLRDRRRNTTTPWSRTPSSPPGTATRSRSTRRARAWRWRSSASPACSASPPENIHIRSPFLGGGFGSKGLIVRPAGARHHGRPAGRPARSSWCCGASRCTAPSATARRPGRRCASAPTPTAR